MKLNDRLILKGWIHIVTDAAYGPHKAVLCRPVDDDGKIDYTAPSVTLTKNDAERAKARKITIVITEDGVHLDEATAEVRSDHRVASILSETNDRPDAIADLDI